MHITHTHTLSHTHTCAHEVDYALCMHVEVDVGVCLYLLFFVYNDGSDVKCKFRLTYVGVVHTLKTTRSW